MEWLLAVTHTQKGSAQKRVNCWSKTRATTTKTTHTGCIWLWSLSPSKWQKYWTQLWPINRHIHTSPLYTTKGKALCTYTNWAVYDHRAWACTTAPLNGLQLQQQALPLQLPLTLHADHTGITPYQMMTCNIITETSSSLVYLVGKSKLWSWSGNKVLLQHRHPSCTHSNQASHLIVVFH